MIKLGYFSHTNISPSETFIYDLVKGLSECDDIDITYVSGMSAPFETDLKVKSYSTGYSDKRHITALRLQKLGQLKAERGEDWKMRFNKKTAFKQLKKADLPNFDIAYVEYATSGVLVMEYLMEKKIPFVVHVHGYDITTMLNDKAYAKELHKLFENAEFFIAASYYMKRRLVLLGCEEDKIKVIRLGVDSKQITPKSWDDRIKEKPSIIFLGRLAEKKNPIALLYAFQIVKKEIPESKLSIIGDGPLFSKTKETISTLNIEDSVKMYGTLSREESFPILNNHWIYAQHSVTSISGDTEGFAISLAEAALHNIPVVSTLHNGITENVIDNETGFLVPEYDYEKMAERIIYLIKNPEIAEKMGKAGREHILDICEPGNRVKKIRALLMLHSKK